MNGYQYVVLRCVPRVEREEFLNVGVVLYSEAAGFLACAGRVDDQRLRALDAGLDPELVRRALQGVEEVCRGEGRLDLAVGARATAYGTREAADTLGTRFGLLRAPRSTVVQPGPVHGGLTDDPAAELPRLLAAYVG
ncbi:hypothetical protein ASG49_06260 [Marmoricola sp. Leaf446]|uniref:DUF3037 domain-containing protein n=1 Tax=Marmoricola sp. Leaf446 TaxID=1736379 RepID=UPI00070204BC|nr:DUF3037 domain-containing protein [Marmoricola sp. Leaf446]KQT94473.1 hypothetical protein ASG49_06260 [Marmoricola sp. Leaf446]